MLWIDLETTGLNPRADKILEVAVIHTKSDGDLTPIWKYSAVVDFRSEGVMRSLQHMDREVSLMHSKNGLLADVFSYGLPIAEIEQQILENLNPGVSFETANGPASAPPAYWEKWVSDRAKTFMLAGNSVHFDRAFIEEEMPLLASLLSHRHFDVRVLQTASKMFTGVSLERDLSPTSSHRALPDIEYSLAVAQAHKDLRAV